MWLGILFFCRISHHGLGAISRLSILSCNWVHAWAWLLCWCLVIHHGGGDISCSAILSCNRVHAWAWLLSILPIGFMHGQAAVLVRCFPSWAWGHQLVCPGSLPSCPAIGFMHGHGCCAGALLSIMGVGKSAVLPSCPAGGLV